MLYQAVLASKGSQCGTPISFAARDIRSAKAKVEGLAASFPGCSVVAIAQVNSPRWYDILVERGSGDALLGELSVELRIEPVYARAYYERRIAIVGMQGLTPEESLCCLPF